MNKSSNSGLPILDIRTWATDPNKFAEELRSACHNVGFFLLRHDLSPDLVHRQLSETKRFFALSLEEKSSISYENNPTFRGYMRIGVENTGGIADVREQVELATEYPERSIDDTASSSDGSYYERLKSSTNPWPDSVLPSLRPYTEEYLQGILSAANRLREAMCVALGLERNALDDLFGSDDDPPHWVLKLISYPKCDAASVNTQQQQQQGVGAHTDTNFLTLVLQDYSGGLQVYTNGNWVDVPADAGPNILVCNLGEQAEILTRGYFQATPHRVMRHTGTEVTRTSVPLFYNPKLSAVINPIEEILCENEGSSKLKWETEDSDCNHWKMKGNTYINTVGYNTFKSLARSHPDIFQKLHPDLTLLQSGKIAKVKVASNVNCM